MKEEEYFTETMRFIFKSIEERSIFNKQKCKFLYKNKNRSENVSLSSINISKNLILRKLKGFL